MIELNFTLLIQIINFLLGLFIIIKFILKPVMTVMAERQAQNDAVRQEAESLTSQAEGKLEDYRAKIAEARAKTITVRDEQKLLGDKEAHTLVEAANEQARGLREQAAREVRAQSAQARKDLQSRVDGLSRLALDKILGS